MANSLQVAIVADDLTGAMDAAAPFARRRLMTRVACVRDALPEALSAPCEVVAVNTETRHLPAEVAGRITAECMAGLARFGPEVLIKKIDSTLRGNVAAEVAAALQGAGRRWAVITPAMPAQGRIMQDGELFVHGVRLKDSPIGRDQRSAPPRRPLIEELRQAAPEVLFRPLAAGSALDLSPAGERLQGVVVDCAEEAQLAAIAEAALPRAGETLLVGSGGLAEAVAAQRFGPAQEGRQPSRAEGLTVFIIGSRTPQAAAQLARLREADPRCRVARAGDGHLDAEALARRVEGASPPFEAVAVQVVQSDPAAALDADAVARALAEGVAGLLARLPVSVLLLTGGDTAMAVLLRLGCPVVQVEGEVLPGIAFGRVAPAGRPVWLVTKAGGFGGEDLLLEIRRFFGAAAPWRNPDRVVTLRP